MVGSDRFRFAWVVCCFAIAALRLGIWLAGRLGLSAKQKAMAGPANEAAQGRDLISLCSALAMTVAADRSMVLHRENIRGLYCFLAVQLLYFVRLGRGVRALAIQILAAAIVLAIFSLTGISLGKEGALGLLYFTLFAGNILWEVLGRGGRDRLFLTGMVLFILCDIHVGIMNLGDFLCLPDIYWKWIRPYSQRALWFFYLPSQALIAMSSCIVQKEK